MAVLKPMLKLALLPLLLLLILAQWVGIFLTTFSMILTNLLAGLFFFVALASWVMKLADGGEILKMLVTAFVVFVLPYRSSLMPLHRSTQRCARGRQGAKLAG